MWASSKGGHTVKDTKQQASRKEQQLNIALGIIRELLLYVPKNRTGLAASAKQRAENFLKAMEEAQ